MLNFKTDLKIHVPKQYTFGVHKRNTREQYWYFKQYDADFICTQIVHKV